MSAPGRWPWFELQAPEADKAVAFYGAVAGWQSSSMDMGDFVYTMMGPTAENCGCGITPPTGKGQRWVGYVTVEDVDAAVARAKAAGAQGVGEPMDVPGVGRMAEITGPDGSIFWVYRAFEAGDKDIAPGFAWNEWYAKDDTQAVAFFQAVVPELTHSTMQMGEGPYHLLTGPSGSQTGIMKQPMPDDLCTWQAWIEVADADAAQAKVEPAGGTVLASAFDVPGIGRMFIAADNQGALIGFMARA